MQISTAPESRIENFTISGEYLVRTSGTSDGTQDKYLKAKLKKFIKKRLVFEAENRYCSTVQI